MRHVRALKGLFGRLQENNRTFQASLIQLLTSTAFLHVPRDDKKNTWWDAGPRAIAFKNLNFTGSLLALGALFGSLSAVYLMDAVGRKASLLAFSVMSLFIGWTLLMAASQVWQLYTGRFLLGLGAGMEITICPVYIHEICRPALRDVCGSFPQVNSYWWP